MIEKLYQQYHPELLRWCHSMTGNLQTAEELVQEAFLRAMLQVELLSTLKDYQCRSWLYRTIKNMYIDRIRHTSHEAIVDELPLEQHMQPEMNEVEWKETIETLPDLEGVIFTLRYIEGYTSKQIGEILSIPPGTVRFKLSSARQHLKETLSGKG